MKRPLQQLAQPGLITLPFLMAAALVALWVEPSGKLRNVHWSTPAPVVPDFSGASSGLLPLERQVDASRFLEILERPVFSPSRRPPPVVLPVVVPPPPSPPPPDPLANVRLYGVFIGPAGGGISASVDGKPRRVRLSESIGDWTVAKIEERDVTFTRTGGETRILHLEKAKPLPPPVIAAAQDASTAPPAAVPASVAEQVARQRQEVEERQRRVDAIRRAAGI